MPIGNGIGGGRPGRPNVLGHPALGRLRSGRPFQSLPFHSVGRTITGTTKDSTGNALAGCTVDLFTTVDDVKIATCISDAAGFYAFDATAAGPYYLVAYKAGAPDVAGTSVNTLVGA